MDELNGIFDQGFSGLLQESNRKTMPDYIEKLAEQEINYEPPKFDVPNILFDKDQNLTRANELTSDGSRESNRKNRFTEEKNEREASDNRVKNIDSVAFQAYDKQLGFEDIKSSLLSKFPREQVIRYLEAKVKLFLDKFSFLGFENIEEKKANIVEQSKKEFKITRSIVHDILEKFSKLDYVTSAVVKEYKNLLQTKRPLDVISTFMFSHDCIKKSFYEQKEARVAFQRDSDEKLLTIRDVDNNVHKNSTLRKQDVFATMLNEYKQYVNSKYSKSEIGKKLSRAHGFDKYQSFYAKFKNDIMRIDRFANRQTFDTDFASSTLQGVEIQPKAKKSSIDVKAMTNFSFNLLTNGNSLEKVKVSLKKNFGFEAANQFIALTEDKLKNHYGQLGYLFIDSNIYENCDKMATAYSYLQHAGSKLIYSMKANEKCSGCSLNKEGSCSKTDLLISNNPIVRSSRATKRVFEKASTFVPQTYIDMFVSQIKDSNLELVSKFALGIEDALNDEKKNIGKQASRDRTESDFFQGFSNVSIYSVNIEEKQSTSKIVDDILGSN